MTDGLILFFSVHPVTATPLERDLFRTELEKAIRTYLETRFKGTLEVELKAVNLEFDPGVAHRADAYIGSRPPGGPKIMLSKSYDWGVKTCYLTGEHFFPPAPLAFFYDGDPAKPVSPSAALARGFTMSSELLRASSALFNSVENLILFPDRIAAVEYRDKHYAGPSALEETLQQWGGVLNKAFQTTPTIPPGDIPAAIAEARGSAPGVPL